VLLKYYYALYVRYLSFKLSHFILEAMLPIARNRQRASMENFADISETQILPNEHKDQ